MMRRACDTHWGEETAYRVLLGNLWERDHFEDLGTDRRIIIK